jgi:hypothetical protein
MHRLVALAVVLFAVIAAPGAAQALPVTAITFGPDQDLAVLQQPDVFLPQSLEPGIKTDENGDIYVNAIRGVPAGSDLWLMHTADCLKTSDSSCPVFYMGQPESYQGAAGTSGNSGGGDIDMDVGAPYAQGDCATGPVCAGSTNGNLYIASLTLANNTAVTCRDSNLSASSCTTPNSLGTTSTDEDREWVAAEGKHIAYLSFHNVGPQNISVCQSTDDAQTFQIYANCSQAIGGGTGTPMDEDAVGAATAANELGNLVVDNAAAVSPTPATCVTPTAIAPSCHYLYTIWVAPRNAAENVAACPNHVVWMAVSANDGVTWEDHVVYDDTTGLTVGTTTCTGAHLDSIFPVIAVDHAGNVYAEWTNGSNIYYESSTDHGTTWDGSTTGGGPPTQVNTDFGTPNCDTVSPTTTCGLSTSIMPWMAATGDGHVDFVWYGSSTNEFSSSGPTFGCQPSDVACPSGVNPPAWSVFFAQTFNGHANSTGTASAPAITQAIASHSPNHIGEICTGGTNCGAGRTLGDFFQVAIEHGNNLSTDPNNTGCAVIAYANDTNASVATQAYFNRQLSDCTQVPTVAFVTHVRSSLSNSQVHYAWQASGRQTVGFNVYGKTVHGTLHRLNPSLIQGSQLNAFLMSRFSYYSRRAHVTWFYLERVGANGQKSRFGPYRVGSKYL